jgi:hypothetical protein
MMSNSQDYQARRYYRGETGSSWNNIPSTFGYFTTTNNCNTRPAVGAGCDVPAQMAYYDIIEVKWLARNMLPNGNVNRRSCGVGNSFDCLVVTWNETSSVTCDPETDTSCYVMQLKIW